MGYRSWDMGYRRGEVGCGGGTGEVGVRKEVGCGGEMQRWDAEGGMPFGGLPSPKAEQDPLWGHAVRVHPSSLTFAAWEKLHFDPNSP